MLRITHSQPHRTLQLEGRLTELELCALRDACNAIQGAELLIDLAGLSFADEAGATALVELTRRGARIEHASPFVQALLEQVMS